MAKKPDIGLRQGRRLCQMRQEDRLAFIAEGFPILLASAQGFQNAAARLHDSPREEDVLVSFADEEAAKILILLDIVRCPPAQINQHIGKLMSWFYNHLARLIYAKATSWKPINVEQLQRYVIQECQEHTLEGFAGEYILPGGPVYERESALYADIQSHDDGELAWHEPRMRPSLFGPEESDALQLANTMQRLGILSLDSLRIVAAVWNGTRFSGNQTQDTAETLTAATLEQMEAAGLIPDSAENADLVTLYELWQLPMYELQITPTIQTIEELREAQEQMLNNAIGDW
ncbi:hypothetical protein [Natronohydrobacter thiooxidans]|uniref:hypothetical protein n=1 Tax=Natronohydrobacter thiooxidans TaxID=87172 RepID=UPI000A04006E|nr:hypothetical protein [Natronohydrobacter thiooxidans]